MSSIFDEFEQTYQSQWAEPKPEEKTQAVLHAAAPRIAGPITSLRASNEEYSNFTDDQIIGAIYETNPSYQDYSLEQFRDVVMGLEAEGSQPQEVKDMTPGQRKGHGAGVVAPEDRPSLFEESRRGAMMGVRGVQQGVHGTRAMLTNDEDTREHHMGRFRELGEKTQQEMISVPEFTEIRGLGDFGRWAVGQGTAMVPIVGTIMAGGAAGGKTGAMAGALAGPKGAVVGGIVGSMIGSFAVGYKLYAGGMYGDIVGMGGGHEESKKAALTYGIPASAVSIVVPAAATASVMGYLGRDFVKNKMKATMTGAGLGLVTEGTAEAIAESFVIAGEESVLGRTMTDEERTKRIINAGTAGGLMGIGTGAIGGGGRKSGNIDTMIDAYLDKMEADTAKHVDVAQVQANLVQYLSAAESLTPQQTSLLEYLKTNQADSNRNLNQAEREISQMAFDVYRNNAASNGQRMSVLTAKHEEEGLTGSEAIEIVALMANSEAARAVAAEQIQQGADSAEPSLGAIEQQEAASQADTRTGKAPIRRQINQIEAQLTGDPAQDAPLAQQLQALYEQLEQPNPIESVKADSAATRETFAADIAERQQGGEGMGIGQGGLLERAQASVGAILAQEQSASPTAIAQSTAPRMATMRERLDRLRQERQQAAPVAADPAIIERRAQAYYDAGNARINEGHKEEGLHLLAQGDVIARGGQPVPFSQPQSPRDIARDQRIAQQEARLGDVKQPEGLNDPRLKRLGHRIGLRKLAQDIVKGGDVSLVPKPSAVATSNTGDVLYDYGPENVIRTPSVNPEWFQSMASNPETQVSVKQAKAAVDKAMKGKRLGVREARVVQSMLDQVTGEREDQAHYVRRELQKARDIRALNKQGLTDAEVQAQVEMAGEMFAEVEYNPEWTGESRAIFELTNDAEALGVDAGAIEDALSVSSNSEAARRMWALINEARTNEQRAEATPGAPVSDRQVEGEQGQGPRSEAPGATQAQEVSTDRRKNLSARDLYRQMTHEQLIDAILNHELTGIKGRRAFVVEVKDAVQVVSIDADSLKWVNDNMGADRGDALLQEVADALTAEFVESAYHMSGDEFYVLAFTQAEATKLESGMARVQARLDNATISATLGDGAVITKKGLVATHAIDSNKEAADYALKREKIAREERGERAGRGEEPPGVIRQRPVREATQGEADRDPGERPGADQGRTGADGPVDLFGTVPVQEQAMADANRKVDDRLRGTGDTPAAESFGDLLSPGRAQQTDITTQTPADAGVSDLEARNSLVDRAKGAAPFSEDAAILLQKLEDMTEVAIQDGLDSGDMPVFGGNDTFMVVHPSAQNPGQYQVTRYNRNGIFGDSQYTGIEQLIDDNNLARTKTLSRDDANKRLAESLAAEADYQAKKQSAKRETKPFTPTHELSDGTPVIAGEEANTWLDADGVEIQDNYATPIKAEAGKQSDDTDSHAESKEDVLRPKTHDDIDAMPAGTIYIRPMNGRDRYLLRGDGRRGGGDGIFDTLEQAQQEREFQRKKNAENEKREAEQKAREQQEAEAKQRATESYGGFLSDSPARAALQRKALEKQVNHKGQLKTRKQMIDGLVSDGYVVETHTAIDQAAKNKAQDEFDKLRRTAPTGNQNHPQTIKLNDLKRKIDINDFNKEQRVLAKGDSLYYEDATTKTGMDYAEFIIGKEADTTAKTEKPAAQEGEQKAAPATTLADSDDNRLRQGDLSVAEYLESRNIDPDDFSQDRNLRSRAAQETEYGRLIQDIRQALDGYKESPEKRMQLDILNTIDREYGHPFRNDYATRLATGLKRRFQDRADNVPIDSEARRLHREAEDRLRAQDVIDFANEQGALAATANTGYLPIKMAHTPIQRPIPERFQDVTEGAITGKAEPDSPWLLADGRIIDTYGDHIDLTTELGYDGYADFQMESHAIRATFMPAGQQGGKPLVSLHLLDGQRLTSEQHQTVKRFVDAHGAQSRIILGVQKPGNNGLVKGIDNPEYQPTKLADLPVSKAATDKKPLPETKQELQEYIRRTSSDVAQRYDLRSEIDRVLASDGRYQDAVAKLAKMEEADGTREILKKDNGDPFKTKLAATRAINRKASDPRIHAWAEERDGGWVGVIHWSEGGDPAKAAEAKPAVSMSDMVAEAARWKGAAQKVAQALPEGDRRAALHHSKQTTKGDLDAYLMRKFGIDESAARDVSNELTHKNIPADMNADLGDFAGEPWAQKKADAPKVDPATTLLDEVGALAEAGAAEQRQSGFERKVLQVADMLEQATGTNVAGDKFMRDIESGFETTRQKAVVEARVKLGQDTQSSGKVAKPEATKEQRAPDVPIEDFGEVIDGARKHAWADYAKALSESGDDFVGQPLSKVWPDVDYQKMIDGGADPLAVALVRSIRDEVPAKPRSKWKVGNWAKNVQMLRDFAQGIIADGTAAKVLERTRSEDSVANWAGRVDLYLEVGHAHSLKGVTFAKQHYALYNGQKDVTFWAVEKPAKATAFGNMPITVAKGDTREKALEAFKLAIKKGSMDAADTKKQTRFDVYSYRSGEKAGKWYIGKKVGSNYVDLEAFDTAKEAREYRENSQEKLEQKLAKIKDIPDHRKENNSPRVGTDHRNGADVSAEQFAESFGFKGVQFGNWVEQGKRQADLNDAYDALMDMAGILNVPARALSLNGELGLAFGARGVGGKRAAKAHYEGGHIVINLTKKDGAGSLAHEWWHALDNYFSRMRNDRDNFLSERAYNRGDGVRPQVVEAFNQVNQAISRTRLRQRSTKLDQARTKPYWQTGREMTARSFESYVIERLKDQSASNDYLANIVGEDYWNAAAALGIEKSETYPYPEAAEIPAIRAAFDNFFQVVETKQDEAGNVAIFEDSGLYSGYDRDSSQVRDPEGGVSNARAAQLAFDLESPASVPAAKAQAADNFNTHYKRVPTGEIRVGVDKVSTPEDAAHVMSFARKHGEEVFYALVLGKDGQILDVQHHSKGTKDGASVYSEIVAPSIASVDGAHSVWFSHNHPSGNPSPSGADYRITERLALSLDGTGIEVEGHVVLGRGTSAWAFRDEANSMPVKIKPILRKRTIPVTERKIRRNPPLDRPKITKPEDAKLLIGKIDSDHALILFDNKHQLIGSLTMTPAEMSDLRGNSGEQARRIMSAIDKANAAAAIIKSDVRNEGSASNLARFLNNTQKVRVLDAFIHNDKEFVSSAERGLGVDNAQGAFFSRDDATKAPATAGVSVSAPATQKWIDAITAKMAGAPKIHVVQSMQDAKAPERVRQVDAEQRSQGATGEPEGLFYQGQAYIVLDGITKQAGESDGQAVFRVFAHEVLGHAGLRGAFKNDLDVVLKEVALKRRADVRKKAAQYGLDMKDEAQRLQAAEEVLAEMAQATPENSMVTKAIEAVRRALRRLYLKLPASVKEALGKREFIEWVNSMTDAEIVDRFLVPAREFIRDGDKSTPTMIRAAFSRDTNPDTIASPEGEVTGMTGKLPKTITIDGKERQTTNSEGKPIADTREGVENFYRWFGDSKVVDEQGRPLVVYHGTDAEGVESFDPKKRGQNYQDEASKNGFFFSDNQEGAEQFGKNIVSAYLSAKRVMDVDSDAQSRYIKEWLSDLESADPKEYDYQMATKAYENTREVNKGVELAIVDAKERGRDGARVIDEEYGENWYVVFDPTQIKSATGNTGTFSPDTADILFSRQQEAQELPEGATGTHKIEHHAKNMALLRAFWDSASDVLRRNGMGKLADAIDNYYDSIDRRRGEIDKRVRPVLKEVDALPRKQRDEVYDSFRRYQAAKENGRKQTAQNLYDSNQHLRKLVDTWDWIADHTGTANQKAGVQVFDPKLNKWREIGKVKGFFPRTMNQKAQDALANPAKHPEMFNKLVDALMAEGHIETREEAVKYISNHYADRTTQDYFAGMEKARTMSLPEVFYDYSWDTAMRYRESWLQRVGQIEQFGQKTGRDSKDLFDEHLSKTFDPETQAYLSEIRKNIYMERDKDGMSRFLANTNMLATGLQLGNPFTAFRNLVGGSLLTFANFGNKASLMAFRSMARDGVRASYEDAYAIGVLKEDLIALQHDAQAQGVSENLSKFTGSMMKWGGYKATEQWIRVHAMLTGRHFLLDALKHWNKGQGSRKSKQYLAFMQRHNIDTGKLLAEDGKGEETNKWLRLAVNIPQGSYKINMVPLFTDTPLGRFLFKYQKFGTQVSRAFWQQQLRPFVKGEKVTWTDASGQTHADKVHAFLPMAQFFATAIFGGTVLAKMLEAIFGTVDPGPGLDEIEKALEDPERREVWGLIHSRAYASFMTVGMGGFFGNYMQMTLDVRDRQRVKNPMSPPGLAPIEAIGELLLRWVDQGSLDARDFDQVASRTVSIYRAGKRGTMKTLDLVTDNIREVNLEMARRDRLYVRKLTRRFADETDLAAKKRAPGGFTGTEMTPITRRVTEELMLGNPESAKAIAREYMMSITEKHKDDPTKAVREIESAWASITGSVRAFDPARVSTAPSEFERHRFLKWVNGRVSDDNYQRVRRVTDGYRDAAVQAGMMKRENEVKMMMEELKRDMRGSIYGSPAGAEMLIDRLIGWGF